MRALEERAEAKINLSLEVIGRRPDGYHDIVTVFQTVDLADIVEARPSSDVRLSVEVGELDTPSNLATRAANEFQRIAVVGTGVSLNLIKHIPIAAGLGGGSADAAATLRACARLWSVPLEQGRDVATRLGADVSFLVDGGTALGEGRGERLTAIPTPTAYVVIASPAVRLESKTARAYGSLRVGDFTNGEPTRALARELSLGNLDAISQAPSAFRRVALELFPGLDDLDRHFMAAGASWTRLSGAGPSLFTVFSDSVQARSVGQRLTERVRNASIFVTRTTPCGPERRVKVGPGRFT